MNEDLNTGTTEYDDATNVPHGEASEPTGPGDFISGDDDGGDEQPGQTTDNTSDEDLVLDEHGKKQALSPKIAKRFAKHTAIMKSQEERINQLMEENERYRASMYQQQPPQQQHSQRPMDASGLTVEALAADPNAPKESEYTSIIDYARAVAVYAANKAAVESTTQHTSRMQEDLHIRSAVQRMEENARVYAAENPTFDADIQAAKPVLMSLNPGVKRVLLEHPRSPEISHAIALNPALARTLNSCTNYVQLGEVLHQISGSKNKPSTVKPNVTSAAPAPGKPVRGSATGKPVNLATMSQDEFDRYMNKISRGK